MSRTLTGWNFWDTPGCAELKTPHGKEGCAQTRSNAGPIRVALRSGVLPKKGRF